MKKPMSDAERKRKSRADQITRGKVQLSVMIDKDVFDKITVFAGSEGISKGEAIGKLIK